MATDGGGGPRREVLTWEQLGGAVHDLATSIADDRFAPDVVLAIARGGLPVAGALAYALGVKRCATMNVELYTGVDERLARPVILSPALDLGELRGLRVLVADDVADTGTTLALVRDEIGSTVATTRSAVLYSKPWSTFTPEYVWRTTDRWVDFPWSADGPVPDA